MTSTDSAPAFHVRLSNFEGPFDLLLQLIFARRLDVTEVALHQVTDEFIAYTKAIGPQLELDETTAFLVVAATLLDLKAARLLPAGEVEDAEDIALLEVRDLLFARLLQYRAFKHVAEMFAELEAAALRSYPRAVSLEDRFADLLPEVMLGVDATSFAQIAATALTPRPVPTVGHRAPARDDRLDSRTGGPSARRPANAAARAQWATFSELVADCSEAIRDRRAVPGAARAVPIAGGSIRPVRTTWCAPGFVDRRPADRRRLGEGHCGREEQDGH